MWNYLHIFSKPTALLTIIHRRKPSKNVQMTLLETGPLSHCTYPCIDDICEVLSSPMYGDIHHITVIIQLRITG
jgi:hypothetical protein